MHVVHFIQKITKTGPLAFQISGSLVPPADIDTEEQLQTFVNPILIFSASSYSFN